MATSEEKLEYVKKSITSYQDFPKPGVLFRDVFSVLNNPKAFQHLMHLIIEHIESIKKPVDVVIGLDSRGFLFGPSIALHFSIPFVPVRKRGKLPGKTINEEYTLEYGKDSFEIQEDAVKPHQNALVVDDLLATGGSLSCTCRLLKKLDVNVLECLVVMELCSLKGREKVPTDVYSLIQYD